MKNYMARTALQPRRANRLRFGAFTLIELLVVIAIIAILAALVVNILPAASQKKVRNRVRTELTALETAINTYHQKRGFYPPDSSDPTKPPPLYHELTGTDLDPALLPNLGTAGILNTGPNSQNFMPNVKPSAVVTVGGPVGSSPPTNSAVALVVPYKGTNDPNPNFWHYNSSSPKFNSDSYDLWADVVVGGKTITIGNWK